MVPAGTALVFDVQGTTGRFAPRTAADVEVGVSNWLRALMDVTDIQITRDSFLSDPLRLYYWNWPYTATVRATTKATYSAPRDAASIIVSAFRDATGEYPTVTVRGYDAPQGSDVSRGPSLIGVGSLLALGAVAVAAMVYLPKPR